MYLCITIRIYVFINYKFKIQEIDTQRGANCQLLAKSHLESPQSRFQQPHSIKVKGAVFMGFAGSGLREVFNCGEVIGI